MILGKCINIEHSVFYFLPKCDVRKIKLSKKISLNLNTQCLFGIIVCFPTTFEDAVYKNTCFLTIGLYELSTLICRKKIQNTSYSFTACSQQGMDL